MPSGLFATPPDAPQPQNPDAVHELMGRSQAFSRDAASVSAVTGVLTGMLAVLTLVPGIVLLATARSAGLEVSQEASLAAVGVTLLMLAVTGAAAAFGLLRGTGWSWPAAVVVCGLQVMVGLLRFAVGEPAAGPALAVALGGFTIYYLFRLEVRALYGRN